MGIRFNCTCGASYKIKDKYGGKLVRCKKCNKVAEAPTLGEQFAKQGTAVPTDRKLAAGAMPPPSFFDTAFIRPGEPPAPPKDTRPKMQTLESYETAPDPQPETPKEKPKAPQTPAPSKQVPEPAAQEPAAQAPQEQADEVDDALSALASASRKKRRGRSSRRRVRRRRPVPESIPEQETDAEGSAEVPAKPEAEPEPDLEQIAFASAKAHARRAQRRAVIYFDPAPQPNKTAEAMKKGFKKFAVVAAAQMGTFATATGRAARHLFSGPDAGQINVIANIGPTRSAQAGVMVLALFVLISLIARAVEPASLGHLSKPLVGVSLWLVPLLLVLLPALMAICFFGAAQLLGQRPEFEEMNPAEPLPEPAPEPAAEQNTPPAQDEAQDPDPDEADLPDQDVVEVHEAEAAEAIDAEEAAEEDQGSADTEPSAPAGIVMPSLSLINAKASVFVTGVALLPLIVQSLILMLFSQISAPLEAALAVRLAVSCFLALLVYHALWGVLNLSQRWAFLITPVMLLVSYSLWMMLARAMA